MTSEHQISVPLTYQQLSLIIKKLDKHPLAEKLKVVQKVDDFKLYECEYSGELWVADDIENIVAGVLKYEVSAEPNEIRETISEYKEKLEWFDVEVDNTTFIQNVLLDRALNDKPLNCACAWRER